MSHTPGPWVVVGNLIQTSGTDRERMTLAQTLEGAFSDNPNATLIAAAPDLLEAARHFQVCDLAGTEIEFRCDRCEAGNEAIRKAEGKENA